MRDWLRTAAERWPDRLALKFGDETLTFRELDDRATRAAAWLFERGVREGMCVALYARSSLDAVVVIYGLMRLGAVLVPINVRQTVQEVSWQIGVAQLVLSDGQYGVSLGGVLLLNDYTKFRGELPLLREFDLDQIHTLVFTSGTSGRPKAAELTYGNHYYSALASEARLGASPEDHWLCCLPLYHVGGLAMLMRGLIFGMSVVLQDGFDVDRVNQALDNEGITHVSLVPTMLYRLIDTRSSPPPHLRLCLVGGAAATPDLVTRAQAAGIAVATTYGMTESASQIATQTVEQTLRKPGSVGKAIEPYSELWIEGASAERLAQGIVGEVVVRGATIMQGYRNEPEATAFTLRNGTLHTGDLGYLDEEGDLWLVQRRSDLIVSGGENVYPAEVEAALKGHPQIIDACVVGLPHPEWGQQVSALVVVRAPITQDEITDYLRSRLAGYKLPRRVRFADALPLTANGKVARAVVTQIMRDGSD